MSRRSQARRGAAIGGLAARQAARTVGTRIAMVGRTERARETLAEQSTLRAAEQFVDVLGKLKGGSMKVGQMLSVLDVGMLPETARDDFRERLEALCSQATPAPFATMRAVIEEELGPIHTHFTELDPTPIGVASIGQVYRAILRDGREVAVKVQYPGIEASISSDIRNLKLFGKLMGTQWPALRDGTIFDEIAETLRHELDYREEARTQASVARAFEGHPYFVVPDVVDTLCTGRVLVTQFIEGLPLTEACARPQAERDRIGELLYRFYVGSLFERHEFCADPHFGNVLLIDDGRLCFLDYGQYHRMKASDVAAEATLLRAVCTGDGQRVRATLVTAGVFNSDAPFTAEECLTFVRGATEWTVTDATLRITPEEVTTAFLLVTDPRAVEHNELRKQNLPAVHLLSRRLEFMTMGVIGRLESEANWHRIAREWIFGAAPETEIGRVIAEWAVASQHSPCGNDAP